MEILIYLCSIYLHLHISTCLYINASINPFKICIKSEVLESLQFILINILVF